MAKNLAVKKPTANNFLNLLEATHLIHRLPPFGYGKEILRARYKIYLADAAIAPSVLLKGKSLLEDDTALGAAVETAFFKHVCTRYYRQSIGFSYWRGGKNDEEVDLIADVEGRLIPFEVKYRSHSIRATELKGLMQFCELKAIKRGYAITRELSDFGIIEPSTRCSTPILKIPAPLACYWLGRSELEQGSELTD